MPASAHRSSLAAAAALLLVASTADAGERQVRTVREARWVCEEVLHAARPQVPRELIEDARCIAVFPNLVELAVGLGGRRGTGVASCRLRDGGWSPPSFVGLTEGSLGLQIGYRVTDLVLFFITESAAQRLVEGRLTLAGDATVAAGPIDRSAGASTDQIGAADIYLYARSRGAFAGVSIEGSRLAARLKANRRFYGRGMSARQLLFEGRVPAGLHPEALAWMDALAVLPRRGAR